MDDPPAYALAHPIYLDVPMMISFLAAIEGGVAFSASETGTESGLRERTLAARAGLRAKLGTLWNAELSGDAGSVKREEETLVSQTERHHTAASLFNVLLGYLLEDNQVVSLDGVQDLDDLRPGAIVQFTGDFRGNPLEDILALASALLPYVGDSSGEKQSANRRSGNPAKRAGADSSPPAGTAREENALRIMQTMVNDLRAAPIHDILFRTDGGLQVVVTAASDFYSAASAEHLREGTFTVVGKVTKVLVSGNSINLTRRTVMGAAGPDLAKSTVDSFRGGGLPGFDVADPIVEGPTVQVLPMAIFI
ncbi:MAG: hypothetical protein WBL05_11225 [Brooklawnia sp.]|uniref:DUF6414 family protein n=1 Tax=Brooklawnia sp. TaxID=2699740 RepID=UPI003C71D945